MINCSLVKYVLACVFLFLLVPLKSYAVGCDYYTHSNLKITSVEVDHYNDRLWVYAVDAKDLHMVFLVNLDNYIKDKMIMSVVNSALLFGYKVDTCSYPYSGYRALYSVELKVK
ncbi:hypothetical protein [Serratia marcescens]|uniref:Uncharacterized protein n=1 Tax=Serratia marcescens TaxID=615 RepID=A0ABD6HUM7_SERMA|nr:hypothetical protein [Serratia marcescens]MDT0205779.1 hypothetical protein [Serratia marcescens]MVF06050.1 hypothetical protein [Serratia marcescens]